MSDGRAASRRLRSVVRTGCGLFAAGPLLVVLLVLVGFVTGLRPLVVQTGSMSPGLRVGDLVLVDRENEPQADTLVAFRSADGGVRVHRVVAEAADGGLVTRGDANPTVDSELVAHDEVLGVVRRVVPWCGLPAVWLESRRSWFLAAVVTVSAICIRRGVRRTGGQGRRLEAVLGASLVAGTVLAGSLPMASAAYTATASTSANSMTSTTWTTFRSVAMGDKHSCAVRFDRTSWCWGENSNGKLGNNTTTDSLVPIQVLGPGGAGVLADASTIAAALGHTCASKVDTSVWCWGRNDRGQMGDATTTERLAPVQVKGAGGVGFISGVSAVEAGGSSTCAVKADTSAWCWGRNDRGQLGDNTMTDALSPVQVVGLGGTGFLTGVSDMSVGGSHTCAVTTDTSVWCWGRNDRGQLGDDTTTDRGTPAQVKGLGGVGLLTGVLRVTTGGSHSCAVKADTTMWCWGRNGQGQLGDNSTTDRLSPVQVRDTPGTGYLTGVLIGDSSGKESTCAIKTDWSTWCWGNNPRGQVGDGSLTDRLTPMQVVGPSGTGNLGPSELLGVGGEHACAVSSVDVFNCWGGNTRGQIGDGTTTTRVYPTPASITP